MLIGVAALVLAWLVALLVVTGLLIAEGRRSTRERARIANAETSLEKRRDPVREKEPIEAV